MSLLPLHHLQMCCGLLMCPHQKSFVLKKGLF